MINKKWLIASIFIPIWGTVVNFILLFVRYNNDKATGKETGFPKKIFLCELLCGAVFFLTFVVSGLVMGLIDSLGASIQSNVGMILAFVIAGLVMNVVFVIYYKRKIENNL